jgi:hypothetical protein
MQHFILIYKDEVSYETEQTVGIHNG